MTESSAAAENCFRIPLIMEKVMSYLPINDLLNSRLMCRNWTDYANTLLLSRRKFSIRWRTFRIEADKFNKAYQTGTGIIFVEADDDEDKVFMDSDSSSNWSTIASEDEPLYELDSYKGGDPTLSLLPEYLEYLQSNPESQFILTNFRFIDISLKKPITKTFLNDYGQTIRRLCLMLNTQESDRYAEFEEEEDADEEEESGSENGYDRFGHRILDSQTFKGILLEQCPNLEELVLKALPQAVICRGFRKESANFATNLKVLKFHQHYMHMRPNSAFLQDLFLTCPNLELAKLKTDYDSAALDLRFLSALSKSSCIRTLTNLTLCDVDATCFEALSAISSLKLRRLKLEHFTWGNLSQEFLKFMESQAESLEDFVVSIWNLSADLSLSPTIYFPKVMPKLKVLDLGFLRIYNNTRSLQITPMDLSRVFPALEKLLLKKCAIGVNIDAFLSSVANSHLRLQALELPPYLPSEVMGILGTLFPHVQELVVGNQSDKSLRQIWTMWPNLKSLVLCVYPDYNMEKAHKNQFLGLDSLFTGIPPGDVARIKNEKQLRNACTIAVATHPSIANLTRLKELTIHPGPEKCTYSGRRDGVTDVSVYRGFLHLPALEFISIMRHEISPDAMEAFQKGMPDLCNSSTNPSYFEFRKSHSKEYRPHKMLGGPHIVAHP